MSYVFGANSVVDSLTLPPSQERELIEYITKLCFKGLTPISKIVRNSIIEIASRELLKS